MRTFGKTMRNSLPAVGLGLLGALGFASVTVATAPAATAQVTAKKEFVENFNAANAALQGRKFAEAIQKADAAWPHATTTQQKAAVEQIRVSARCDTRQNDHKACIDAIEKAKGTGGLPAQLVRNYDEMLAGRYESAGQSAKALAQTKANISKYGGTGQQLAFVARKELEAKNYNEAIKFINQAIAKGSSGSAQYNILLNAYAGQNKMDEFYKTVERIAPSMKQDTYWRMLIERTKKEANYRSNDALLDVYRALQAAGVKLSTTELNEMADAARKRGLAIEAVNIWEPLFKSGALGGAGDKEAARNKSLFEAVKKDAQADLGGELAKSEADAATRVSGDALADVAEAYLASGNATKAIEIFQKALDKGQMDAGKTDLVKLRMGVAQFQAKKKSDATKTWQSIKSENGAAWLAKSWIAIAKM
ncbi:MAG: hypothetical protein R3C46_13035 [Hyphomonadaceae bacterium]